MDYHKKIWELHFSNLDIAFDYAGNLIRKDDYNKLDSEFAWNLDHCIPISKNGEYDIHNLVPVSIKLNQYKADKTTFYIEDAHLGMIGEYQIVKKSNNRKNGLNVMFKQDGYNDYKIIFQTSPLSY